MTIKSILELTAMLVNQAPLLDSGVFSQNASAEKVTALLTSNDSLRQLLKCVNIVLKDISCYEPLKHTQNIFTENGTIYFLDLEKNIREALSVTSQGQSIPYTLYCDRIETRPGNVCFTYAYIPPTKDFFDIAEVSPRITERTIACGAAAEYCLAAGRYPEAVMWDKRYKDALILCTSSHKYKPMPSPSWR